MNLDVVNPFNEIRTNLQAESKTLTDKCYEKTKEAAVALAKVKASLITIMERIIELTKSSLQPTDFTRADLIERSSTEKDALKLNLSDPSFPSIKWLQKKVQGEIGAEKVSVIIYKIMNILNELEKAAETEKFNAECNQKRKLEEQEKYKDLAPYQIMNLKAPHSTHSSSSHSGSSHSSGLSVLDIILINEMVR